jgi:hypothetical protein
VLHSYLSVSPHRLMVIIRCRKITMGHVGVADMKASQHDLLTSCETWSNEVLGEK